MKPLTKAQQRILNNLRERSPRVYNGRARAPLMVLQQRGLVRAKFDLVPSSRGLEWEITAFAEPWEIDGD